MQQHTQGMGDQFQVLWPSSEAPPVPLLEKKGVFSSNKSLELLQLYHVTLIPLRAVGYWLLAIGC